MSLPLLRTPVEVPPPAHLISYEKPIVWCGSCFAEEIGGKMEGYKFACQVNPFGVLYNPASIARGLERVMSGRAYEAEELVFDGERWFSFDHHGRFSHEDRDGCLEGINGRLTTAAENLRRASHLFVTFGTARVFALKEDGRVVANCHKQPAVRFARRLLTPAEIVALCEPLLEGLRGFNGELEVVFTVSPVRHWKDGAAGNQQSKAALILAVHQLVERGAGCGYFPAYEIVMDELRDYRFYAEDMLHVSAAGVNYVWERFAEGYVGEESRRIMGEVKKLVDAAAHRPFDPGSESHRTFVARTVARIDELGERYPFLDLEEERKRLVDTKE